jgi:hypothetical protein
LVGLVELPTGRLLNSVYVRKTGIEPAGTNPQCPTDCGNVSAADSPLSDAGAEDADAGGGSLTSFGGKIAVEAMTFLPFSSSETNAGQEFYVGARNADVIVPLRVNEADGIVAERSPFTLFEGANGVHRLRPSIEPFAVGPTAYLSEGNVGRYLYVIAGDSSVRVVDITNTSLGGAEVECDANIDTKVLATQPGLKTACMPVGLGLPRTLRAKGPGIQIPPLAAGADLLPPHPVDVAFFRTKAAAAVSSAVGRAYDGVFAYVMLSNGDILVVNVDTKQSLILFPGDRSPRAPFAHSLRNSLNFIELDKGGKQPRVSAIPTASLGSNGLSFAVRGDLLNEVAPRIEGFPKTSNSYCSPEASTSTPTTVYACFDRPEETTPQNWAVVWEGALAGTLRDTGRLADLSGSETPGTVANWQDVGAKYCAAGVQPGDVVRLIGCNFDNECGPEADFVCSPSVAGTKGLCVRRTKAAGFAAECGRLLKSRRRYEITTAGNTSLGLGLKLQENPKPSIIACNSDAECAMPGVAGFACVEPVAGQGRRCVVPCANDLGCTSGFVCEITGSPSAGFCVEAPLPTARCLEETKIYTVQAGKSFLVQGSFTPSFASAEAINGRCEPLASRNPRFQNRIPFSAPQCSNFQDQPVDSSSAQTTLKPQTADLFFQSPMTATGFSNPCFYRGINGDDQPSTPAAFVASSHVKAFFEGPEMKFVITNLEQPFGDGLTLQFQVQGGFRPDQVVAGTQPQIALPTMLVTGPTLVPSETDDDPLAPARYPYIYIVDSGRLGNEQHGQILRVDTRRAAFDVAVSKHPFQVR